jgi:hypothetical protein
MIEKDDVMIIALTSQLSFYVHVFIYSSLPLCISLPLACVDEFLLSSPLLPDVNFLLKAVAFFLCVICGRRQDSCILCNWR